MKIERFEDLTAWQEARLLVKLVYQATKNSAFAVDRDLTRQVRRAATSVMSNIAEGFSRYSFKDSKQFFVVARGSLAELRSHAYVALDQRYVVKEEAEAIQAQVELVGKLVSGLIRNARRQLEASALETNSEPLSH